MGRVGILEGGRTRIRVPAAVVVACSALLGCSGDSDGSATAGEDPGGAGTPQCIALVQPKPGPAADALVELNSAMEADPDLRTALLGFVLAPGSEIGSVAVWAGGSPLMQMQQPERPDENEVASAQSAIEAWADEAGDRFAVDTGPDAKACGG